MGREAGERRVRAHDLGGPRPDDWSLACDPHMGVVTTRFVLNEGFPVLRVVCDEDGDWQFVDNVHDADVDDALLVCLHHVLDHDPSLTSLVSDLEPSRAATRPAMDQAWIVEDYTDA